MKKYFIFGLLYMNLVATDAWGYECSFEYCSDTGNLPIMLGCTTASQLGCLGGKAVNTCNKCRTGYDRVLVSETYAAGGCSYEYYACERSCTGCSNCISDPDWSAGNTGYQQKTTRTCDCNTCNASTSYRCAAGYYGTSTNGTSGCTRCPSSGGVYGTSAAGSTSITSCYLPSGTTGSDSTGSFTYTGNCYYSN